MNSSIVGVLRALLTLDTAEFEQGIRKAQGGLQVFSRDMKTIGTQATATGSMLMRTVTLPIIAAGGAVAAAAIQFESSFAGIRKTVNATEPEFAKLAEGMRGLSKVIPVNVNELNRIGEAAGQLGIKTENILGFTEVMAKLGVATNLTSEEAATMLARFDNITTGGAQETFEELGSTIVALGNNLATTEKEILEMGMRLAGAGRQIGLTQADILSLGGALSSLGLEAEAGGTAFSRVMIEMQNAVLDGGKSLETFEKVAGDTFRQTFKKDAAQAINDFIGGLARMSEAGQNINPILDELGLGGIRVSDSLRRTGNAVERVTEAVRLGRQGWADNNALTEEARKRFETTEKQLVLLWNRIKDVGITLGNALLPMIRATIKAFDAFVPVLEKAANVFAGLPMPIQMMTVGLGLAAAAAGPLLFVFGQVALSAAAVSGAFTKKGIAARTLGGILPAVTSSARAFAAAVVAVDVGLASGAAQTAIFAGAQRGLVATFAAVTAAARATGTALLGALLSPLGALAGATVAVKLLADAIRASASPDDIARMDAYGKRVEGVNAAIARSLGLATPTQRLTENIRLLEENTIGLDEALQRTGAIAGTTVDEIVRLEEEAAEAARATAALTEEQKKLTATLAGADVLQAARNYELAVRSIGGASRLTGEEKQRYADVLDAVIDKYRLLGSAGAGVVAHFTQLRDSNLIQARTNLEAMALAMSGMARPLNITPTLTAIPPSSFEGMFGTRKADLDRQALIMMQNYVFQQNEAKRHWKTISDINNEIGLRLMERDAAKMRGVFGNVFHGMKESLKGLWEGLSGGKGIGGVFENLGKGIMDGFGQLLSGGITNLINKGIGLAVSGIKTLFGGPSQQEMEGREAGANFRKGLEEGLNTKQRAEAAATGNAKWASSVIAIRDAYLAAGRTEAEALAAADRLWRAEKKGGDAVKKVQEEINAVMEQGQAIRENAAAFASELPGLLNEVASSGALVSAELRTIIDRVRETGELTGELRDFVAGQTKTAATGLAGFLQVGADAIGTLSEKRQELADLEEELADASEGSQDRIRESIEKVTDEIKAQERAVAATAVTSAASAQAFAAGIFGAFSELQRQGLNVTEALEAVQPAVEALDTHLQHAGLSGGAAFDSLRQLVKLSTDEIAGPAFAAVGSLNQALIGLHNAALLDQDTFAGLAGQVTQTFNELVRQGKGGDDALRLMQPTLQTIWQLQKDFGFAVDDATQKMLDQGETAGIVGDQHRSAEDRIAQGIERLIDLMADFIRAMGVDLPNAAGEAEGAIGGVRGALENIPSEVPDPFRNWSSPSMPDVPSFTDGYGQAFHKGGLITAHMGRYLGPRLGAGEVMVKALAGEGILSHAGMRNLGGPGMLEGLNRGAVQLMDPAAGMASAMAGLFDQPSGVGGAAGVSGSGADPSVVTHVHGGISVTVNGAGKNADQIAAELAPKILREIDRYNPGGSRSHFKRMVRQAQVAPA